MIKSTGHFLKTYLQSFQAVRISDTNVITSWIVFCVFIFLLSNLYSYVFFIF